MAKAVRIDVDGSAKLVDVNGYDDLSGQIGGYIEHVTSKTKASMYIDEEGKIKNLPANIVATSFWGFAHDVLCGPVIVFGEVSRDGDDTDVSPESVGRIDFISKTFRKLAQ